MGGKKGFVDPEIPDIVQVLVSPMVKMLSRRSTFGVRLLNYQEPRFNYSSRTRRWG
jgi:hypothetical protein